MRIAVLSDCVFETPQEGGHGLGRMVHQVAEGLLANGHDVIMFAKVGSRFSGVLITPPDAKGYEGEPLLAKAALEQHKAMPFDCFLDNTHTHYLSHMIASLPVVSVFHDIYQQHERCAVLLSEGQRAVMPVQFESARIIHNTLNAADYVPFYDPTTPEYALMLGMSDLKQPILAVEACARMGLKLVIGGASMVGKFPVTDCSNVEYVGAVSGKRKADLYRHAKVYLQLSKFESYGLTTLEASLSATPVVAWPSGGNLDLVRYGVSGAFVIAQAKDKVQAVADAIERASFVPRQMCRAWGEALCQPERQIDLYEDALGACAKGLWW
jgi:glycosyltransferase involved in cell wall biosynthesis